MCRSRRLRQNQKKGEQWEIASLTFHGRQDVIVIKVGKEQGIWLSAMLQKLSVDNNASWTRQQVQADYEAAGFDDFELFWDNKPVNTLYKFGLLHL